MPYNRPGKPLISVSSPWFFKGSTVSSKKPIWFISSFHLNSNMCCVLWLRSSDACIKWQLYTAILVLVKKNYDHLQLNKTKKTAEGTPQGHRNRCQCDAFNLFVYLEVEGLWIINPVGANNPIAVKSGRGVSSCQDRCCFGASLSHRKSPNSVSAWLSTVSQCRRLKGYMGNLVSFSLSTLLGR